MKPAKRDWIKRLVTGFKAAENLGLKEIAIGQIAKGVI